jgi:hypothetical protein
LTQSPDLVTDSDRNVLDQRAVVTEANGVLHGTPDEFNLGTGSHILTNNVEDAEEALVLRTRRSWVARKKYG